jgi:hypothetical protein
LKQPGWQRIARVTRGIRVLIFIQSKFSEAR